MSIFHGRAEAILHPTDFSAASELAFAHALAVALANRADLTILHVARDEEQDIPWHEFPSVRQTLEQWGILAAGSRQSDVLAETGIRVDKRIAVGKNVVSAVAELAELGSFDLLVMGTNGGGWPTLLSPSSSSIAVAKQAQLPSLFVKDQTRSCVDPKTGHVSLNHVLLAVDGNPDIQAAIDRTATMLGNVGGSHAHVTLLHVGPDSQFPQVDLPAAGDIHWSRLSRSGHAATEITQHAAALSADLIVMMPPHSKPLWELIAGNTVQQVLKNAPCPVFTMPS